MIIIYLETVTPFHCTPMIHNCKPSSISFVIMGFGLGFKIATSSLPSEYSFLLLNKEYLITGTGNIPPFYSSQYCTSQRMSPTNPCCRDFYLEVSSFASSFDNAIIAITTENSIEIGITLHDICHDLCLVPLIYCYLIFYVVFVTQNLWADNGCFQMATNEIARKVKCISLIG